jgi:hypothetical protein
LLSLTSEKTVDATADSSGSGDVAMFGQKIEMASTESLGTKDSGFKSLPNNKKHLIFLILYSIEKYKLTQ